MALKLSPDINNNEISKIIELIIKYKISGIIVSNTTEVNRENLSDAKKMKEADYQDSRLETDLQS